MSVILDFTEETRVEDFGYNDLSPGEKRISKYHKKAGIINYRVEVSVGPNANGGYDLQLSKFSISDLQEYNKGISPANGIIDYYHNDNSSRGYRIQRNRYFFKVTKYTNIETLKSCELYLLDAHFSGCDVVLDHFEPLRGETALHLPARRLLSVDPTYAHYLMENSPVETLWAAFNVFIPPTFFTRRDYEIYSLDNNIVLNGYDLKWNLDDILDGVDRSKLKMSLTTNRTVLSNISTDDLYNAWFYRNDFYYMGGTSKPMAEPHISDSVLAEYVSSMQLMFLQYMIDTSKVPTIIWSAKKVNGKRINWNNVYPDAYVKNVFDNDMEFQRFWNTGITSLMAQISVECNSIYENFFQRYKGNLVIIITFDDWCQHIQIFPPSDYKTNFHEKLNDVNGNFNKIFHIAHQDTLDLMTDNYLAQTEIELTYGIGEDDEE